MKLLQLLKLAVKNFKLKYSKFPKLKLPKSDTTCQTELACLAFDHLYLSFT